MKEWPGGKIEQAAAFLLKPGSNPLILEGASHFTEIEHREGDGQAGQNFLRVTGRADPRAQGFVAIHQTLHRLLHRAEIDWAAQPEADRLVVGNRCLVADLAEKPELLLCFTQRDHFRLWGIM